LKIESEPLRLNIGSGDKLVRKGYVNIDAKFGDMAYPLAYPDNSVDEIYASHILEHFGLHETMNVLKDWARVLKPGGWLKVAVPDFDFVVEHYRNGNPDGLPIFGYLMGGQMNGNDYHKSVFNYDALANALVDVGLNDVQRWESEVEDCASLPVSLNLMAQKPSRIVPSGASSADYPEGRKPQGVSPSQAMVPLNGHGVVDAADSGCPPAYEDRQSLYKAFVDSIPRENHYSQFFEDAAIEAIFKRIGTTNKWCVECGAGDGLFFSNTRRLIERGWKSLQIEADEKRFAQLLERYSGNKSVYPVEARVGLDRGNRLEDVFDAYDNFFPVDFDLLVLDIDGQDYHVLNTMVKYKPRVLVVEYNPDCDPMYIPEPGAPQLDQAGLHATGHVAQARGYEAICRTPVNLICVRQDLAHLFIQEEKPADGRHFVNGEWHEKKHLSSDRVQIRPAVVMSTPRYGPLDAAEALSEISARIYAPRFKSGGAFWEQGLTRSIEMAMAYRDDKGSPMDVIVSMDYDTFATPEDAKELIRLLYQNPQYDCIVPMQARRGVFNEMLATTAGPVDFTQGLVPIVTGHFGLTVFRRRVFEGLRKPWLLGKASENGDWNDGRTDADIYFWQNFGDCGFKAALAPGVVIGHGEDAIVYPRLVNGQVQKVYISVFEWLSERSVPENAGVIVG
jgi:SAM-dependent methyltransferase